MINYEITVVSDITYAMLKLETQRLSRKSKSFSDKYCNGTKVWNFMSYKKVAILLNLIHMLDAIFEFLHDFFPTRRQILSLQ